MHKFTILYSWSIKLITCFFPDIPLLMRFRGFLYSIVMKSCGRNFQVCSSTYINSLSGLTVGNNVYLAHNVVVLGKDITIEDEVLIGPNSVLVSGNHTFLNSSFRFGVSESKPIIISKGSWIGANCTILAGAKLPEQSILGAGSVLSSQYNECKTLYAGAPAKPVKLLKI